MSLPTAPKEDFYWGSNHILLSLERWVGKWVGEMGKNDVIPVRNNDKAKGRLWWGTSWWEKDESFGESEWQKMRKIK